MIVLTRQAYMLAAGNDYKCGGLWMLWWNSTTIAVPMIYVESEKRRRKHIKTSSSILDCLLPRVLLA